MVSLPFLANALTLAEMRDAAVPFLYGIIGFFGALAFGIFGAGLVVYLVRMSLDNRMYGIDIMIWGVTILFVVVLLIGLLVWIQ
ncbi:MAG: hypothetical protein G01um10148_470 [Parcubacteria group bacterium Gr01-1014_8]|nr:MAG: hypothetical protein G01um10148_470 [Parcubacteria group bacterium Gr01-1014_8]